MGRTQINVRVNEEQKSRWDEFAEESAEYASTSDMIRQVVNLEIRGGNRESSDPEVPDVDVTGARIGEVLDRLQNLRNDMQDLESGVNRAVDAVHAQSGVDPDIPPDVYQALPTGEEDAMSAEDVAHATGHREVAVRFALENMRRSEGMGVRKLVEVENEAGERVQVRGEAENVEGYRTNTAPRWYLSEGA